MTSRRQPRRTPRSRSLGGEPLTIPLSPAERGEIRAAAGEIPEATWARAELLRAARQRPR